MEKIIKIIEKKAKEYSAFDYNSKSNSFIIAPPRYLACKGYENGAKWMFDKIINLLEDCMVFDKLGIPISIEDFRKTLEE